MENMQVRPAVMADADGLAVCIKAAYAKYADTIPDLPPVSEGCDEEIANNQVWVATLEDQIIGGLVLVVKEGSMKLANLAVDPQFGGRGIGRAFMTLSLAEAKRQGFNEMRLNTHKAMPDNVRLYQYWGWQVVSEIQNTIVMKIDV